MALNRISQAARAPTAALAFALAATLAAAAPSAPAAPQAGNAVFAKVGGVVITHDEFEAALAAAARNKFYHGKPPEGGMAALQREVGRQVVDDVLILREAQRRKIQPDHAAIADALKAYEERYASSPQWRANRDKMLPGLKAKLERDSVVERLKKQVQVAPEPTQQQLHDYWQKHQDKFTTPERVHVSMILLRVDPGAPQTAWNAAREQASGLAKRAREGADFAELAKQFSKDPSAERGGDLGSTLHRGQLPELAQAAVDKLQPGQLSDAVMLLEGMAVFRLHTRHAPKLNPLAVVRERARDLWMRDAGEQAWTALLAKLRRDTPIELDESRYLPLPVAATPSPNAAPR